MVGRFKIANQTRENHIRCGNLDKFEYYYIAIDRDYETENAILNGYVYKINIPQFNLVNRGQYGNGCDFKQKVIESRGNNCFIPTKGYCFVKCTTLITGEDYKEQYLELIRNEKRRSKIMTKARIQPFCIANNIKKGSFDGIRVFPRSVTD